MIGLFLGAGFSKWCMDLPLAKDLFDFNINIFGVEEQKLLSHIKYQKKLWDSENEIQLSEKFVADILIHKYGISSPLLWYIARRLSDPFIYTDISPNGKKRRRPLMFNEYYKNNIPGIIKAKSFIHPLINKLSGIITTNYDTIIEYILGTKVFNYGMAHEILSGPGPYRMYGPVSLNGKLSLAKLHGSISWNKNNARFSDSRCGITGDALIIAPTPDKKVPKELKDDWKLSAKILNKSTKLVVFGFAFNSYDTTILEHLKKNGKNISKIILIDIYPNHKTAQKLWPQSEIINFLIEPNKDLDFNKLKNILN